MSVPTPDASGPRASDPSTPNPGPRAGARETELSAWQATAAHFRAVVLGAVGGLTALLFHRPDVLVLATPFLVVATWSWLTRPEVRPRLTTRASHRSLREGEGGQWISQVTLPRGGEDVLLGLAPAPFVDYDPALGVTSAAFEDALDGVVTSRVAFRPTRWGVRSLGPAVCRVSSAWGGYTSGPSDSGSLPLTVLPLPAAFDTHAPAPHPEGLVGMHRANRVGGGTEFDTLRVFQPGDRLRRIHWPSSLRTGTLHVTSTYGDEDSQVVLVIDAFSDLGPREGIHGRPTSLDQTVRAAGAIAEHHLVIGDRVGVRVVGSAGTPRLHLGTGRGHLRRVLETVALIQPATERTDDGQWATAGIGAGALVIVLSPLIDPAMVTIVARLGARGLTTVVVDTIPPHLAQDGDDLFSAIAWRLRGLTRETDIDNLSAAGIPVVPWRGPASLDVVLRDISRRSRAPRLARR
ncbi:MAG: DUF58 domain-containing protein [Lapillicoccus sp.]